MIKSFIDYCPGPAKWISKWGCQWKTEKHCRPPWLADKKNFRILDALEWLKQQYFDLGDSLLIVSALKPSTHQVSQTFLVQ